MKNSALILLACSILIWPACEISNCQDLLPQHILSGKDRELLASQELAKMNFDLELQSLDMTLKQMLSNELSSTGTSMLASIELVDSQKQQLKELLEKTRGEVEELRNALKEKGKSPREIRLQCELLEQGSVKELRGILLPVQLRELTQMRLHGNGIHRVLVESKIGDVIDLSEAQKMKIKERAISLSKEVEEFMHKARKEAADSVFENLTEEQVQKLESLYGRKAISNKFEWYSIESIFNELSFESKRKTDGVSKSKLKFPWGKN